MASNAAAARATWEAGGRVLQVQGSTARRADTIDVARSAVATRPYCDAPVTLRVDLHAVPCLECLVHDCGLTVGAVLIELTTAQCLLPHLPATEDASDCASASGSDSASTGGSASDSDSASVASDDTGQAYVHHGVLRAVLRAVGVARYPLVSTAAHHLDVAPVNEAWGMQQLTLWAARLAPAASVRVTCPGVDGGAAATGYCNAQHAFVRVWCGGREEDGDAAASPQ